MRTIHTALLSGLLFSVVSGTFLGACSSDDGGPAAPSRPPVPSPTTPNDDGGPGNGGDAGSCFDTTKAKPTAQPDFLNQCNAAECFPFDNAARIEGFDPDHRTPPLTN